VTTPRARDAPRPTTYRPETFSLRLQHNHHEESMNTTTDDIMAAAASCTKYELALGQRLNQIRDAIDAVRSAVDTRAERAARNELWYYRKKATDYSRAHALPLPTWADSRTSACHDRPEDR
jgi:hypothetical protein